jgi:SAM-dependent methyltransferase
MVRLSSLEELGLDLSGDALEPFLDRGGHGRERWQAEMALRRRRILVRLAKHLAGGWLAEAKRSTQKVRDEYDAAWAIGHERYDVRNREPKVTPWLWRGRPILFDAAGAARFRLPLYAAVIKQLKPRHILEVGSGDGINLLLLAGAFPEISFTGLELTAGGIAAARKAQDSPLLGQSLQEYSPLVQEDKRAYQRVQFIQGNACAMPFQDAAFDVVLTVLAIEQMERVRQKALTEIARVTGKHLLSLEPFREVNRTVYRRINILTRDYFRGSIGELANYGLQPLWATADFPQEVFLGAALVLSVKQ